jgi:hypothetical protein
MPRGGYCIPDLSDARHGQLQSVHHLSFNALTIVYVLRNQRDYKGFMVDACKGISRWHCGAHPAFEVAQRLFRHQVRKGQSKRGANVLDITPSETMEQDATVVTLFDAEGWRTVIVSGTAGHVVPTAVVTYAVEPFENVAGHVAAGLRIARLLLVLGRSLAHGKYLRRGPSLLAL